jgi:hypothetical protein
MMLETFASRIIIRIALEIRQYISASGLPFWSRQWSCPSIHSDIDIVARAHSEKLLLRNRLGGANFLLGMKRTVSKVIVNKNP